MIFILLGGIDISTFITDIKPDTKKIGMNKQRALDGTLWVDYSSIKNTYSLLFETITKQQRDSLFNLFNSSNTVSFTDHLGITKNYMIVDEGFPETISTLNSVDYYTITLNLEEI